MKIYLFNDTIMAHAGSQETMHNIYEMLNEHEIIKHHKCHEFNYDEEAMRNCEAVVINGEGSIHHNNKKAQFLMDILSQAIKDKKYTYLINTTYQEMPKSCFEILRKVDYLQVREWASYQYLLKNQVHCDLRIDMSINNLKPRFGGSVGKKRCVGQVHHECKDAIEKLDLYKQKEHFEEVTLNEMNYQEVVSYLYWNAKTYITGQYHGVIAGLMADCYVIPIPSNSWKIEGLLMWAKSLDIHPKELLIKAPRLEKLPPCKQK